MSGLFDRAPRLTALRLPPALRAALLAAAEASPTLEVCGLFGGHGELATSHYATANVSAEPATSFYIEPRDQLRAMQDMRTRGESLLGIYHSHPQGPALPSARDRALAAYPGVAYLIVSLANAVPEIGCFVFDGEEFRPLPLLAG